MKGEGIPISLMEEFRTKRTEKYNTPKDNRVYSKLTLQGINQGHLKTSI
jgi:hypothetical protein